MVKEVAKKIKLTKIKSSIGAPNKQKATVKALGLGKIGSSITHKQTPDIMGMAKKIKHLIKAEEVTG